MPPPKQPTLYNLNKTTIWFSVSAFVLFVSLVAMVLQDSIREWKGYQRDFINYSREKAEGELVVQPWLPEGVARLAQDVMSRSRQAPLHPVDNNRQTPLPEVHPTGEARAAIGQWLEEYNTIRPHGSLNGRAPAQFIKDWAALESTSTRKQRTGNP